MYVYANRLWIDNDNEEGFASAKHVVATWLSYKVKQSMKGGDLIHEKEIRGNDNTVRVWSALNERDSYPWLASIELRHGDSKVSGRQWITQIGLKQKEKGSSVLMTVVLETSDISTVAGAEPVVTTRPKLIEKVHESDACRLAETNIGQQVISIDIEEAEKLQDVIDQKRDWALVLVSPDPHIGEPLVDIKYLQGQVLGLAQVVNIPENRDAYKIYEQLGPLRSAHNGAINILHPRSSAESDFVPRDLLLKKDIIKLKGDAENQSPVAERILQKVAHRQNLRHFWSHVSPEKVRRFRMQQKQDKRLQVLRQRVSETQDNEKVRDLVEAYGEINEDLRDQLHSLDEKNNEYEMRIIRLEDELKEKASKIKGLQYSLRQKQKGQDRSTDDVEEIPNRDFRDVKDVADVVRDEMVNRIHLRSRAAKSMRKSPYLKPEEVYAAFALLNDVFYKAFTTDEISIEDAKKRVKQEGIEYSHNMSDKTMGQYDDYSSRYKGRDADMNKHLKLGNGFNPQHSFRIHFEWDEEDQVIAIHHAGKHPTNTKS